MASATIPGPIVSVKITTEHEMLRASVRDFVERVVPKSKANELEQSHEFPQWLWDEMAKAGLHAVGVPEEYGGAGGDIVMQMIVAEELARSLAGLTWAWGITSFSGAKSVGLYGTEEQKRKYLPEIAEGKAKWSIAITEPSGGTDVLGAMKTVGRKVDGGWVVNGSKIWSTMAHLADYSLLVARTQAVVDKPSKGLTVFIVPANTKGFDARPIPKIGMRAIESCMITLDEVFVSDENVLGEVNNGWKQFTATLNNERIMVAALCCGVLQGVLEDAVSYAKDRMAFGKPIGQMQRIQHYIATWLELSRLITYKAAQLQSEHKPAAIESTMAKMVASEYANQAADLGIQILGGMGYSTETDMQRYWRDSRLYRIGPITNEMCRNFIGEQLGLGRSF
jgi:alkylation response protein AidB-like acyl-CoA dehydrogenase